MEVWLKLVKWCQEHLCKTELQRTLETCTKELTKLGKYHSDVRLLRLWVQLADCLPDPADIFAYLRETKIGIEYALFYEAHATYYELKGNYSSAESSFTEGIERNARPIERLKQKSVAFQKRMAQRIQRKIQEESLGVGSGPVRGSLSALGVPQSLGPSLNGQQQQRPSVLGVSSSSQRPGVSSQRPGLFTSIQLPSKPQVPLATPVAVDEEFGPRSSSHASIPPPRIGLNPPPLLSSLSALGGAPASKELKPFNVTQKENNERPGMWTGAPLGWTGAPLGNSLQSILRPLALGGGGGGIEAPKATLDICVDDEFEEDAHLLLPVAPPPPPKSTGIGLRQRIEPSSSDSAEPIRASQSLLPPSLPSLLSNTVTAPMMKRPPLSQAPLPPSIPLTSSLPLPSVPISSSRPPLGSIPLPRSQEIPPQPKQDDVTMSTKAAFDILNDLFTEDEGVGRGVKRPAPSSSMPPPPPRPPVESTATLNFKRMGSDVTVSTREAFDIMNDLFSDSLPHEEEKRSKQRKGLNGLPIAHRAALANQMAISFKEVPPTSTSSFSLHEDTELVGLGSSIPPAPLVYEDTIDLGPLTIPAGSGLSSGMNIYEDTQFF